MTFDELKKVLGQITYKPGIQWNAIENRALIEFNIAAMVEDADKFGDTILITQKNIWTPEWISFVDEQEVVLMVRNLFKKFEDHEVDEWFRFRGKKLFDPHAVRFMGTVKLEI